MPRHTAKIEVGDLVEFRAQYKIQKFLAFWNVTGIVTEIYKPEKGKNVGEEIAKVYFAKKTKWYSGNEIVPCNKELTILLKRLKKVRR